MWEYLAALILLITWGATFYEGRNFAWYGTKAITIYKLLRHSFRHTRAPPDQFVLHPSGQSGVITYNYQGKSFQLCVPFERRLIRKMTNSTVELSGTDGTSPRMWVQQPGIPFLVTPSMLGKDWVNVTDLDSGEVSSYDSETVPNC